MYRIKTFLILLLSITQARGQTIDSLRNLLDTITEDTIKVFSYYQLGDAWEPQNKDSATFYYKKGRALAEQLDFKRGIAAFSNHYIVLLNQKGLYNEALQLTQEALHIYKNIGDKKELAIAYLNIGNEWHYLSDFQQAAEFYIEAQKLAEETGLLHTQRITNNNLAAIFISLEQFEKGIIYAVKSLSIARQIGNQSAVASSLYNIATAETYLKQYDIALIHFREIEEIGLQLNDDIYVLDGWLGAAGAYSGLKKTEEAKWNYDKVIKLSKEKQAIEYELYAYMGLADLYINAGRFQAAAAPIASGIAIALKNGSRYELKDLYQKAAKMEEGLGNAGKALSFWKQYQQLNDSVINEKNTSNINLMEAKYESEKKESRIQKLEDEKKLQEMSIRQSNLLNYLLIGGSLALVLVIALLYRTYAQKQKIQQQRISELETEKKLSATEAVLRGEEQERSRLAKDLHDGLGGMLSGIKYAFQNMKGNLVMTPDNQQAFERSMDMLDSSIKEMRRVAHNMMPEALVKFGLNTALQDFCNDINQSGALKVHYQSIGLADAPLEHTTAITIYRIIQELINNSMKHAAATNNVVQVTRDGSHFSITVEDDGKGFDPSILEDSSGIGFSNIRNRVDFLKGRMDVHSKPGQGVSVLIEFNES